MHGSTIKSQCKEIQYSNPRQNTCVTIRARVMRYINLANYSTEFLYTSRVKTMSTNYKTWPPSFCDELYHICTVPQELHQAVNTPNSYWQVAWLTSVMTPPIMTDVFSLISSVPSSTGLTVPYIRQ